MKGMSYTEAEHTVLLTLTCCGFCFLLGKLFLKFMKYITVFPEASRE